MWASKDAVSTAVTTCKQGFEISVSRRRLSTALSLAGATIRPLFFFGSIADGQEVTSYETVPLSSILIEMYHHLHYEFRPLNSGYANVYNHDAVS
jgi:hypothetical protein